MIKHRNQKQFGEEIVYLAYISQVKSSESRQKPGVKNQRRGRGGRLSHGLVSFAFLYTPGSPAQRVYHLKQAGAFHICY